MDDGCSGCSDVATDKHTTTSARCQKDSTARKRVPNRSHSLDAQIEEDAALANRIQIEVFFMFHVCKLMTYLLICGGVRGSGR